MEAESSLNWIKLLPDFHSTFPVFSKMLGLVLNTSSNFCLTFARRSFDAGRMQIKSSLNLILIKLLPDFHTTFPFPVLEKVGSCRNRLNTLSNFCSTFARHSFDAGRMNVGQKSKPFKRALMLIYDQ